jgi:hypothetical protein
MIIEMVLAMILCVEDPLNFQSLITGHSRFHAFCCRRSPDQPSRDIELVEATLQFKSFAVGIRLLVNTVAVVLVIVFVTIKGFHIRIVVRRRLCRSSEEEYGLGSRSSEPLELRVVLQSRLA